MRFLILFLAFCLPFTLLAQTTTEQSLEPVPDAAPDAPPPPQIIRSDDADVAPADIEPTVTIKTEDERRIEEYRIRGRLYMIKVTSKNAPSYYLIDTDGDGLFESRQSDIQDKVVVPKWVLTEW
jgi:hypothetical protein